MADEKPAEFMDPQFGAVFSGGPWDGLLVFLDSEKKSFSFVESEKDEAGVVIRRTKYTYDLAEYGKPLQYRFRGQEPYPKK